MDIIFRILVESINPSVFFILFCCKKIKNVDVCKQLVLNFLQLSSTAS